MNIHKSSNHYLTTQIWKSIEERKCREKGKRIQSHLNFAVISIQDKIQYLISILMFRLFSTSFVLVYLIVLFHSNEARRDGIKCRKTKFPKVVTHLCLCEPCFLCKSSVHLLNYTCAPRKELNMDDGSHAPRQPELNPKKWFLNSIEMTASRNGVERKTLSLYTERNLVRGFVDSESTFASMYEEINGAGKIVEGNQDAGKTEGNQDFIYLTAWCMQNSNFNPATFRPSNLKDILMEAGQRGSSILALIWQNIELMSSILDIIKYINVKIASKVSSKVKSKAYFDSRVPGLLGTHHQKTMIIKNNRGLVAFVGGVDPCWDRWDSWRHNKTNIRSRLQHNSNLNGWIDESQRIQGLAAKDVLQNFIERWNDPTPLGILAPLKSAMGISEGKTTPIHPILRDSDILSNPGNHSIQITRTFSCKYKGYSNFAPKGEISMLNARIKAIKMAKNYIYIQDQYFFYVPQLVEALMEVLPHIQRLIVIVQYPLSTTKVLGFEAFQYRMIRPLMSAYPNKIHFYRMQDSLLYIHSKTIIIDDVFVSIGSGNWNKRSMTSDSELAANSIDSERILSSDGVYVSKFAHTMRTTKWAEASGLDPNVFASKTIIEGANLLDESTKNESHILKEYRVGWKHEYALFEGGTQDIVDSDGRCGHRTTSPEEMCKDKKWLNAQSTATHIICSCILKNKSPLHHQCDDIAIYASQQHEHEVRYLERKSMAIVLVPVCIVSFGILTLSFFAIRKQLCSNQMNQGGFFDVTD